MNCLEQLYRLLGTRRPLTGPRSITSAITRPATGQNVQRPPNQLLTAEYQSRVVGRKTKPMIGQRMLSNTPRNQCVKNQRIATTRRGAARASSVMIHGIGQVSSRTRRSEVEVSMIPTRDYVAASSLCLIRLSRRSHPHCSCEMIECAGQSHFGTLIRPHRLAVSNYRLL